ncbi:MAG: HdeD family acid-resistance protein [Candidatus Coproplasma sp.]
MTKKENDGGLRERAACLDGVDGEIAECELPEVEVAAADAAALQAVETTDEVESEDLGTLGDKVVDVVSLENNVEEVCKHTKLPEAVVKYLMGIVYIALGVVCAAIPHMIESVLPYIVGGILGVFAILRFIFAMIDREYEHTNSNKTASSIILLGVSIMIIVEHEWAHSFIPIVWGVWGLFEGAHAFNHAFARIAKHRRFLYFLVKGITEVVVAFLLLYEPQQYGELHIIVFGISLILDGVVALPFVHRFVTRR